MPVIEIKRGKSQLKLYAVDRNTLDRMQQLLIDLSHPGSPVADKADAVKTPLAELRAALPVKDAPSTEGSTEDVPPSVHNQ